MTAIALNQPVPAFHPKTGKPVTVVGIDSPGITARLVVLVHDGDEVTADVVEYVVTEENKP